MGELIPFSLERINTCSHDGQLASRDPVEGCRIRRQEGCRIASSTICVKTSLFTTSGVFDQAAPNCAIAELGIDHVLFSIDDPFEDNFEAVEFSE